MGYYDHNIMIMINTVRAIGSENTYAFMYYIPMGGTVIHVLQGVQHFHWPKCEALVISKLEVFHQSTDSTEFNKGVLVKPIMRLAMNVLIVKSTQAGFVVRICMHIPYNCTHAFIP